MNEEMAQPVSAETMHPVGDEIAQPASDQMIHMEPEQFDELVSEVIDSLPDDWAPLLDNIAIVVEEEPAEDDLSPDAEPGTTLLGLYRGTAVPAQFLGGGLSGPAMAAPIEIALFQGPLERVSVGLDDLRERVRQTLVHEIGHHFGYSEDRLQEEEGEEEAGEGDEEALEQE